MNRTTRRSTRRLRKQLTSRDAPPFMLVVNDRHSGELLEAVGRLLFRYRSELAPIALGLWTGLAGIILHATHPGAWPWILLGSLVASGAVLKGWLLRRLDRVEERVYAAATTSAAGGWLASATALGVSRLPLPWLLLTGTAAAGVPWWTHRRRRARVTVDRTIRAWPEVAESIGLMGSQIVSATVDAWGWRARVSLRRGQTVADAVSRVPAIESGLGTRRGAVRVTPDETRADRFALRVLARDPHAEPVVWTGPSAVSICDPIELGVYEDASPVRVSFLRRHALIGGIAGSGKSGVLNVILANLAACPDVVLWGIDLKGGMELRPWAACLDRLATTAQEAADLLRDGVGVLDGRAGALSHRGLRVWEPSTLEPALVIVVDEYAELAEEAQDALGYADSIARRGRAVAVTLLAATQRPTQQAMGKKAVRSQMDVRLCLRVRERRDVDLVLGQGMLAAGWAAHALDAPGKFLLSAPEANTPQHARAYLITDAEVSATAGRYGPTRTPLDALSQSATQPPEDPGEDADVIDAELVEAADEVTAEAGPETALLQALNDAPLDGRSVADLMRVTGMGRTWVYGRLQEYAAAGRVVQVSRGRWRSRRERGTEATMTG
ncbi:FtsK/SpoIIIE domain-containing protein [Streptomyces sp. RB6PN25]|uniref:FtsK/SpoIIIE domain-containing protein n=1 Tax=Streptomyces humicola TaxID=2953240 RepID=A0ABT1PX75_9ACTN|nr:FtsK/SpoIIIE domain-containing protein [Streptomyces humicola]MCQ4081140.1 FtsK/SpoIIIE domain-containing protein [Streptomyces humicola]